MKTSIRKNLIIAFIAVAAVAIGMYAIGFAVPPATDLPPIVCSPYGQPLSVIVGTRLTFLSEDGLIVSMVFDRPDHVSSVDYLNFHLVCPDYPRDTQ